MVGESGVNLADELDVQRAIVGDGVHDECECFAVVGDLVELAKVLAGRRAVLDEKGERLREREGVALD